MRKSAQPNLERETKSRKHTDQVQRTRTSRQNKADIEDCDRSGPRPTLSTEGTRKIYSNERIEGRNDSLDDNNLNKKAHQWATKYADQNLELGEVRELLRSSVQDAQALLLQRLDEHKASRAVSRCGTLQYPCGHRYCPACSHRWHKARRIELTDAFAEMPGAKAMLIKVFSRTASVASLKSSIQRLITGCRRLRKLPAMASVKKFAGILEISPILLGGHLRWSVHLHGIAEFDDLDVQAIEARWRDITKARNSSFGIQPIWSREAYVKYIGKTRDRCPTPDSLRPTWLLKILVQAMKGQHCWITWGLLTKRGKKRRKPIKLEFAQENREEIDETSNEMLKPESIVILVRNRDGNRVWRIRRRRLATHLSPRGRAAHDKRVV